jgi:hypothetical protein
MAITNYTTACGSLPLSFIQLLAATIYGYHDIAGNLHYRINSVGETDECSTLTAFGDCELSHIEPERLLVENVFALDSCDLMSLKVFDNDYNDLTDFTDCGAMPQSFIQMLARCIVTHDDSQWLNTMVHASTACTDMTPAYECSSTSLTDEVAESILVGNLFAYDDCDLLGIKMIENSSTMTDYHTECEVLPQSFYQLLARCVVLHAGHYRLNVAFVSDGCTLLHAFWSCDNNHTLPERALVENIFAIDSCGNLALKLFANTGREQQ